MVSMRLESRIPLGLTFYIESKNSKRVLFTNLCNIHTCAISYNLHGDINGFFSVQIECLKNQALYVFVFKLNNFEKMFFFTFKFPF